MPKAHSFNLEVSFVKSTAVVTVNTASSFSFSSDTRMHFLEQHATVPHTQIDVPGGAPSTRSCDLSRAVGLLLGGELLPQAVKYALRGAARRFECEQQ
jgi:hypothetical protein